MTVDAIFERLKGEWPVIAEAWLSMALLAVVVGGAVWAVVHFLNRKQNADVKKRLELRDDQLANAKAEIKKAARDLESLEGERQTRQNLEALLASLREQLAIAQQQLAAAPLPTAAPSRESPRQTKFDELFGPGSAIDGKLTKEEAERLIGTLHELTNLMKARRGCSFMSASRWSRGDGCSWEIEFRSST